jgi:predicted PurR-regulated permease PerM
MLLVFLIVFVGIEQVNSNIIIPKVLGSILGLRGVWIMLAVALFGALFGVWGMFLSAPIFSILYALIRDAVNAKLKKQGDSTSTDHYTDMFASTAAPRRRNRLLPTKSHQSHVDEDKQ